MWSDIYKKLYKKEFYLYGKTANAIIWDRLPDETKMILWSTLGPSSIKYEPGTKQKHDDQLTPFWENKTIYDESIFFVKDTGDPAKSKLLFEPTEILSVKNRETGAELTLGTDYSIDGQYIVINESGSISYKTTSEMFPPSGTVGSIAYVTGDPTTWVSIDHGFTEDHIVVSYKHNGGYSGFTQSNKKVKLSRTFDKVDQKKGLKIAIIGDSICDGASASWYEGATPGSDISPRFMEGTAVYSGSTWTLTDADTSTEYTTNSIDGLPFWMMVIVEFARQYEGQTISFLNKSLPGYGISNAGGSIHPDITTNANAVAAWGPDLIIEGFGVNDASAFQTEGFYRSGTDELIALLRASDPTVNIILIGTHVANPVWHYWGGRLSRYTGYLAELQDIEDTSTGIVVADMTNTSLDVMNMDFAGYEGVKDIHSVYVNDVNHGADWWHTIYAQVVLRTLGLR